MTDFDTPAGFVACVAAVRSAKSPMTLYFHPSRYSCCVRTKAQARPDGMVKVGVYDAKGSDLARVMRLELGMAIARAGVPRGTSNLSEKSMTYYKAESGRRA